MAVTKKNNKLRATADNDTFTGPMCIEVIRVHAGSDTATIALKDTDTSGTVLWQSGNVAANAVHESVAELTIESGQTIHIDMTGTSPFVDIYFE